MILSNNLRGRMRLPKDAIIRVNVAWIKSIDELERVISENHKHKIFLDYPSGRTKPPVPTLELKDVIDVANDHTNIKYFAVSNAEDAYALHGLRGLLNDTISLVPKIETIIGVVNIEDIAKASKCDTVMLDKEDLYLDLDAESREYEKYMQQLKDECKRINVRVLELVGVAFD